MPHLKPEDELALSDKEFAIAKKLPGKIRKRESFIDDLKSLNKTELENVLYSKTASIAEDLISTDYLMPVHVAARSGNLQALQELVSMGASLRVVSDPFGKTVVDFAKRFKHQDVLNYLNEALKVKIVEEDNFNLFKFPNASLANNGFGNTGYNPKLWQDEPKQDASSQNIEYSPNSLQPKNL